MIVNVLLLLSLASVQPGSGPAPTAGALWIARYQPDLGEALNVLAVNESDPRLPSFIVKRKDDPSTRLFFRDGRHQLTTVEADDLITYLPLRSGTKSFLVAGKGLLHSEVIVYRFTHDHSRMTPVLHVGFPNSNQAKVASDFLLLEGEGRPPRLLVIDHQYGDGGAGAVLCFEIPADGTGHAVWKTDQPLFSNPRPLFLHRRADGRQLVMVDNRSHLAAIDPATGRVLWNERYADPPLSYDRTAGFWTPLLRRGVRVRIASDPYNKFLSAVRFRPDGTFERIWENVIELGYENQSVVVNCLPRTVAVGTRTGIAIEIWREGRRTVQVIDAETGRPISAVNDARLVHVTGDERAPHAVIAVNGSDSSGRALFYGFDANSVAWRRYDEPLGSYMVRDNRFGTLPTVVRGSTSGPRQQTVSYSKNGGVYLTVVPAGLTVWNPSTDATGEVALLPTRVNLDFGVSPWGSTYTFRDRLGRHFLQPDGSLVTLEEPPDSHYVSTPHIAAFFHQNDVAAYLTYVTADQKNHSVAIGSRLYEPYLTTGVAADGGVKVVVHNGQELIAFDANTAAEEWRLTFSTLYQCSRNATWVTDGMRSYVLVMLDRDILKIDTSTGEVVGWKILQKILQNSNAAFTFRPSTDPADGKALLADGNGTGLLDLHALDWRWSCVVPEEGLERVGVALLLDGDGVLDLVKPWDEGRLAVISGATGEVLRMIPAASLVGTARLGNRDALFTNGSEGVSVWTDSRMSLLPDLTSEGVASSGGHALIISRSASKCEIVSLSSEMKIVGRREFSLAGSCTDKTAASPTVVGLASGSKVELLTADLGAVIGTVEFPDPIVSLRFDRQFSERSFIAVTENGDLWLVSGPPAADATAGGS